MKNIRLFLQFALFVVIVVAAISAAPRIGQVIEGQPFEAGQLSAPDIDRGHGHGDAHGDVQGDGHAEPQGDAHGEAGDVHGASENVHGPAVAEETAEVEEPAMIEETSEAMAEEVAEEPVAEETAEEATTAMVEQASETGQAVPLEQVVEQVEEVTDTAAPALPADLVIQPVDPATAKMAPVAFSHAKHEAAPVLAGQCAFCHHKGGTVSCTTAGCHTDASTKKFTGATENVSFEAAFHAKSDKSCVGCHRALKSGPTKCNDCHPK